MVRDDHLFRLTKANSLLLKSLVQWKRETIHLVVTNASMCGYRVRLHFYIFLLAQSLSSMCSEQCDIISWKSDGTTTLINQNSISFEKGHVVETHLNQPYTYILTSSVWIFQLFTDHSSISYTPKVTTHCPPLIFDAHLHSTLILIGASHQMNISIGTVATGVDYRERWSVFSKKVVLLPDRKFMFSFGHTTIDGVVGCIPVPGVDSI